MAKRAKRKMAVKGGDATRADVVPVDLPAVPRNFSVLIDHVEIGFAAVSQLASMSVDEPSRGRSKLVHRYANVLLRRALGSDRRLYTWREAIMAGKKDRRRVEIRQLDESFRPTASSWVLEGAWPCRWAGPIFDANATEIAMEEIELAFERMIWR